MSRMMPKRRSLHWPLAAAAAAVAVGMLAPGSAFATVVSMSGDPGAEVLRIDMSDAVYGPVAQPWVDIFQPWGSSGARVRQHYGGPLHAGAGCTVEVFPVPVDSEAVSCAEAPTSVVVEGGPGPDRVSGSTTVPVRVSGGAGNDVVSPWSLGALDFSGGGGDDTFQPVLAGYSAVFSGGSGKDTLDGYYLQAPMSVSLDGVANDQVVGGGLDNVLADVEVVKGGKGDDRLVGTDGPDDLDGGEGTDVIEGNGGDDRVDLGYGCGGAARGGSGDDEVLVRRGGSADGGPGDDRVRLSGPAGPCDRGTDVHGGGGTDLFDLQGEYLSDDVYIATLDDVADDGLPSQVSPDNVHSDVEDLQGGQESDVFIGSDGPNRFSGGSMPDLLVGGKGDDHLNGEFQDDVLDGGPGADELEGGIGLDLVDYSTRTSPVTASLDGSPSDDGESGEGDTIASDVEDLRGGEGDDLLVGGPQDNVLIGGGGADRLIGLGGQDAADYSDRTAAVDVSTDGSANDGEAGEGDNVAFDIEELIGGSGDDVLSGGPGDNRLDGGTGADDLIGGGGRDAADYSRRAGDVVVSLDGGSGDDGEPGEGDTVGPDVEDVIGGSGADRLRGGPGDNTLNGGPGADEMSGGPGLDAVDYSDRLVPVVADLSGSPGDDGTEAEGDTIAADVEGIFGGASADFLTGSGGSGFLVGGPGNDHLTDRGGADRLSGGGGNDVVASRDGTVDSVVCGSETDRATADAEDDVDATCETVDLPPEPSQPTSAPTVTPPVRSPPVGGPVVPPNQVFAPRAWLTAPAVLRSSTVKARGIGLRLATTSRCSVTATAVPTRRTSTVLARNGIRRGTMFASGTSLSVEGPGQLLRLRVSRQGRRMLRLVRAPRFIVTARFECERGSRIVRTVAISVRR